MLDNRSHLSLRDGATLSRCRSEKFEHNDPASLDASLGRNKGKRQLVVIEGIYSMDGDFGNLEELIRSPSRTARASSSMKRIPSSPAANTAAAQRKNSESRTASPSPMAHFRKRSARLGGFVAGSRETLQYLRFYAHPYVYSCALPPVVVAAILKALEIGATQPELRRRSGKTPTISTSNSKASASIPGIPTPT